MSVEFFEVFSTTITGDVVQLHPSQFVLDAQEVWKRYMPKMKRALAVHRIDKGIKRPRSPRGVSGVRARRREGACAALKESPMVSIGEVTRDLEVP